MRKRLIILGFCLAAVASAVSGQTPDPIVRFNTTLGYIDVQLSPGDAPQNVANFLSYVDAGDYVDSIFHRSVPGFIIQGGGYYLVDGSLENIPAQTPVINEFKLSNVRGTIAFAKVSGEPNSATDEWYFNLADNSANLDTQDGGFTVFGHLVNTESFAVMDAIAALEVIDASSQFGTDFTNLPVVDYTGTSFTASNFAEVSSVTMLPSHPAFFNGEVSVGNAVNYLTFSSGNYFGYYSYLTNPDYLYHFDLGYEYVFDANDGKDGIYFYDFASDTFFYTSPTFPFPYLYDFSLHTILYYFPDTTSAGHYTTNPRSFFDYATGAIITK